MASEQKQKKKSGAPQNVPGVEGSDYEVNLLTLLSLKALFSNKIADFQIESNNAQYGKFDDIVLTLTPVEGKEIKIAFQLKHKTKIKFLKREQLENESGNFSIDKYFEGYQKIKLEDKNSYNYVLFTNSQFDPNSFNSQVTKLSIVQDTSEISFNTLINICDSDKIHKFRNNKDTNQNEFLDRFYLFSSQNNEKEVENEIEEIFTQNFGADLTEKTASVLKVFRDFYKGRFTKRKILNKTTLVCHLINLLITRYSTSLEQSQTGQESLCEHFYNAVKLFDVTHISCENMDFLKQNLKQFNYVGEKSLLLWAKYSKFIDSKIYLKDFEIKSVAKVFRDIENQPIFLSYQQSLAEGINSVMKFCIRNFPQIKFILAGSETDFALYKKDPELNRLNLFENLSSLKMKDEEVYQQLINQFYVEVNGRKLTSLTDFISFDEQIVNNITPNVIVNSLKTGVIKFGDESNNELPLNYIPRQISGDVLSFTNIAEDRNTLFIISCGKQLGEIQDFLKTRNLNSLDFDKIENKTDIRTNIILTASETDITEEELKKKIRHDFRKTCYLEAIIENENFLGYFRYRKHKKEDLTKIIVEESEIQKYFQRSVEVVSATPGMGKTTLMKSIVKNCPDSVCILIPLKDYSDFFKEKHSIVDLLNQYFSKNNVSTKFQKHLTSYILHKFKVIFLLDGFDETDQNCHNNMLNCIKEVRNNGHKVWISTRPNFSELLCSQFDVNDLEIVELNESTQKEYIKNRLSESKKVSEIDEIITKIYENIIIERHQTLLGTPLLLHMITEMIINNEDLSSINNVTDLFKKFFKGKFLHHANKDKREHRVFKEAEFEEKLETYEIPALKSCLETNLFNSLHLYLNIGQLNRIKKWGDGLGIIVNVSEDRDNPNFSFFHNTYAEYFAAKWLAANYTRIPTENRKFLLEDKYENLKFMFDNFIAEGCLAHIAVLCKDEKRLATCSENEIVKIDKLNRSVWHIICQYGDKFPSTGISNPIGAYRVNKNIYEFQPKNPQQNLYKYLEKAEIPLLERDFLLNKTALDYATERFSINIVDHICKVFKTPDIDFNEFSCLKDNKYLIIYYSLKFGYLNLLKLNFIRNVLKTKTIAYYQYPVYIGLEIRVNVVNIAAQYGQLEVLKYLYSLADSYETFHGLPLHVAAYQGHLDIVKELIAQNADVNATDKYGRTPLMVAAENGHLDVVKELIAHKADVNATDKDGWTAFRAAAQNGHLDVVKELIAHKADVNAADKDGWTALRAAAQNGHLDVVKELIAHKADVNAKDKYGRTPLMVAAENGHLDVVKELIAHKADVNATDEYGWTALRAAAQNGHLDVVKQLIAHNANVNAADEVRWTALMSAAQNGHLDVVKELIAHKADVNAKDKYGRTPLMVAAENGHLDVVKELIAHKADVNATDEYGWTALRAAAQNGHLDVVKQLIAHNANVNAADEVRWTALMSAAQNGHLDVVKELIAHKADVNATNKSGWTALMSAAHNGHLDVVKELIAHKAYVNAAYKFGWTALRAAAQNGHLDVVKELIAHKADVNARDEDGWTPLFWAANNGHLDVVKELIAHKADVNAADKDGWTPLRWAAQNSHLDVVKELIAHNADVNATDEDGWTPLRWAAQNGHLDVVKELIAHKADVNAADEVGWTALMSAAQNGHLDVVKELIAHKADVNAADKGGWTALMSAAQNGHLDVVKELIAHKADVNAADKGGWTALMSAAHNGHLDVVKELIAHNANVNAADEVGWTALMSAAQNGHLDVVKELIAHKADVNAADKYGKTPLFYAEQKGRVDIVTELKKHLQNKRKMKHTTCCLS